jgi:hypothetical protein
LPAIYHGKSSLLMIHARIYTYTIILLNNSNVLFKNILLLIQLLTGSYWDINCYGSCFTVFCTPLHSLYSTSVFEYTTSSSPSLKFKGCWKGAKHKHSGRVSDMCSTAPARAPRFNTRFGRGWLLNHNHSESNTQDYTAFSIETSQYLAIIYSSELLVTFATNPHTSPPCRKWIVLIITLDLVTITIIIAYI